MFSFLNQKNIQQIICNNCFLIFPKLLYKIQTYLSPSYRNFVHESHRYLENSEGSNMACFSSYPRGSWTPPLPRNYYYLKIIFPSKSRVLTECGHRQHHELGEYETTHSLYTFLSISFLSLFHYRSRLSLLIHSRVHFSFFLNHNGFLNELLVTVN